MRTIVTLGICVMFGMTLTAQQVGIGINTPTYLLDVREGVMNKTVAQFMSTGGMGDILVQNGTQQVRFGVTSAGGFVGTATNHDFRIRTGGADRIALSSGGLLGIGTLSPGYRLDVQTTGTNSTLARFMSTGGIADILVQNNALQNYFGVNDETGYIGTSTAHDFRLRAGAQDRVSIQSSTGNVGIGLMTPTYRLESFVSASDMTVARFGSSGGRSDIRVDNMEQEVRLGVNASQGYVGTPGNLDMSFVTDNLNRVTIEHSSGKVGVGTEWPQAMLHVSGDIRADSLWIDPDSNQADLIYLESGVKHIEQLQYENYFLNVDEGWQSFKAMSDATILELSLFLIESPFFSEIRIYAGEGTSGTELASADVSTSQTGWFTFPELAVALDSGGIYTFWLDVVYGVASSLMNPYPHGRAVTDPLDICFKLNLYNESFETPFRVGGSGPLNLVLPQPGSDLFVNGTIQSTTSLVIDRLGVGTAYPETALDVDGDFRLSGSIGNEPVNTLSMTNGWVNFGGAFETAGYYKDKEGVVHLRGMVKLGLFPQIAVLPEGYRPPATLAFIVVSGETTARIDVNSDGQVSLVGVYSNVRVSLSGISFRVD